MNNPHLITPPPPSDSDLAREITSPTQPARIEAPSMPRSAQIRQTQSGIRGAIKSLGAWGAITLASLAGGKVAGNMSAQAAHRGVAPIIESINEAVTPKMCRDDYEGFKGIILDEMNGRIGRMINGALDSVDMKPKIQKWLDAITTKMNAFREDLCSGLKKIPELTNEIDQGIQKFTKVMVRWMTTAMMFLALSMIYRGRKRAALKKMGDDALIELEQELAQQINDKQALAEANTRVEQRVKKLEQLLRDRGMMTDDS